MFRLTWEDRFRLVKLVTGEDICLPVPPRCQALWQRATDAGWTLNHLHILKAPLLPGTGAAFNTESRDCWVLRDPDERVTIRRLLHELAHATHTHAPPSDIDGDWGEEAAVTELAFQLAQQWGVAEAFTPADLEQELAAIEQHREDHWAAARLAGSEDPRLARAAYSALVAVAREEGWGEQGFVDALHGWIDDPQVEATIHRFDRCALRPSWRLLGREGQGFDALNWPLTERGAALLREALRSLCCPAQPELRLDRRPWGDERRDFGFLQLREEADIKHVIAHAQALLLRFPEESALACWTLFGTDGPQRIYRLELRYGGDLPSADLWVLATPDCERAEHAEAAWHTYVRGWSRHTTIRQESLGDGLQALWEALSFARQLSGHE